ncbi:hypothetical protein Anas_08896 [Armadillidium nasatum]|uniref:Uncharacterized protein n=1 Tax=Armadillidium nasatum TaxID=96803 RepID=A0A5N5SZ26_9CRUS|nr:hypothetical protein Anas_08896 [Armadillidium nasatum]
MTIPQACVHFVIDVSCFHNGRANGARGTVVSLDLLSHNSVFTTVVSSSFLLIQLQKIIYWNYCTAQKYCKCYVINEFLSILIMNILDQGFSDFSSSQPPTL